MDFIINNWFVILAMLAVLVCAGATIYKFFGMPTQDQIKAVKEWLLYAVTMAEKELGSGTGELKLRFTYDLFVTKFPMVAKVISFELFSAWVDEALDQMKKMLETNQSAADLININK